MKYIISSVLAATAFLHAQHLSAQQSADSVAFAKAIAAIAPMPAIKKDAQQITPPTAPPGYKLLLRGTDRLPVIDREGHISTPLTDAAVSLYFVLQRTQDSAVMDVPNINVTVPGKYAMNNAGNPAPFVIPALREWYGEKGNFMLPDKAGIVIDPVYALQLLPIATTFLHDLRTLTGKNNYTIRKGKPAKGDIYFTLQPTDKSLGEEGYLMKIGGYINIDAIQPRGAFWATRTILQILEQDKQHQTIPQGITRDYPKYAVRGFVLDVGRKFFTLEFLRHYVKFMSYYKMNDFHIHLNDNGFEKFFGNNWDSTYSAFRLENDTYPGLTAKDGSYTKKEFIALQQLAGNYAVTIIPEIDIPAHSLAFTKAVPQTASLKYGRDHLNLDSASYAMVDNVFKEYLQGPDPVFKGDEVHIGTDEYAKKESEKFRTFADHYIRYVESFGKKVRMWGSLTHAQGKTPVKSAGVTMNAWYNGYADPKEMMRLGYDLISTPDGELYIVPAAGYYWDYLDTDNLYQKWEPNMIGNVVFPMGHPQIRGGSFAVWNDHVGNGITEKDVHDRVFPAMQTLAEKMWNGHTAQSDYFRFLKGSENIGEGPGLNMRAKVTGTDSVVLAYDFSAEKITDKSGNKRNVQREENVRITAAKTLQLKGNNSFITTPLTEIGYNYTVQFDIKPAADNKPNAVIFSSPNATVTLLQQQTGKLGFTREAYHYHFNYVVPAETWTHIAITGNNLGTALYVNGKLIERLQGTKISFPNTKDSIAKIQTLVFPLQIIGDQENGFKGEIDNLKVWNVEMK
ncbi:hexosaminidase [Chitinophaga niastensis]|uniref:Hexosaminidase n=1 Tax=Chitinophaga niastensis TaxID=536980 RepID=A0A2P8HV42_CHINA|nr:family 20 glycosylhydrolase [Chitinophaga niastensis]PSL50092.1 hexosaminidase [Chitinophaga niastensis]